MSLKKQAIHGVKWTTVSAVIAAAVQLIQVAVLAHFLDKRDFGLMALAIFIINISQIFIDMGVSNAIIYKQKVTHNQLSSLYWLNIFLGIIIFFLLFLVAPWAAKFYKEPELAAVIIWVGITFLIQPFGQQFEVLLKKELAFKSLAIRDIFARITGLIVAILLAYYQYGVYALVFANLATIAVSTLLLFPPGLKIHKPRLRFKVSDVKDFFGFGLFQMGEKFINYFNYQFDTLIIGKLLGVGALGVYNIAKSLTYRPYQVINPIITKVSFPVMAKAQDNISKVKAIYLLTIRFLTSVVSPVYLFMFIFAKPLVFILFGSRWIDAVMIVRLLSLAGLFTSTLNPVGSMQLALGRADLGFYWNFVLLLFIPVSIWIGSFWGLTGVAASLVVLRLAVLLVGWRFMIYPLCKAKFFEYFGNISGPLSLAVIAAAASFPVLILFDNKFVQFILGGVIIGIVYLVMNYFFNKSFIEELKNFIGIKQKATSVLVTSD